MRDDLNSLLASASVSAYQSQDVAGSVKASGPGFGVGLGQIIMDDAAADDIIGITVVDS